MQAYPLSEVVCMTENCHHNEEGGVSKGLDVYLGGLHFQLLFLLSLNSIIVSRCEQKYLPAERIVCGT